MEFLLAHSHNFVQSVKMVSITYNDIFQHFHSDKNLTWNVGEALKFIQSKVSIKESEKKKVVIKLKTLVSSIQKRFKKNGRNKSRFLKYSRLWLEKKFNINTYIEAQSRVGRPTKKFSDLCVRNKRRRVAIECSSDINGNLEKELYTVRILARKEKKMQLMGAIDKLLQQPNQLLNVFDVNNTGVTPEEALACFIDNGFSKSQYVDIYKLSKKQFPSYGCITAFKKKCSPSDEFISVSETKANVTLQALVNHTAERIVKMQSDVIIQRIMSEGSTCANLVLLCSWGIDGSSGHSIYHQRFEAAAENETSDNHLLVSALSPIRLSFDSNEEDIVWLSLLPQSVRFCRPIEVEFVQETKEKVLQNVNEIKNQIRLIVPFKISLNDTIEVTVSYNFYMSLIDGKVLAYVTNTSSMQNCCICGAKPTQMNNLDEVENGFCADPENLNFGISPLHCWMRFLDCLLHISYRLDFKRWSVTKNNKPLYLNRKKLVLKRIFEQFGLKVDEPRPMGASSTTGNVCRRLFMDTAKLSHVLEIEEELVDRFRNILIAINCSQPLNPFVVGKYCKETYLLYLKHYNWYKIPSSVHKVLAHAGEIIINAPAPIGALGEEAAESRHKFYRRDRREHARKCSRALNLIDIFKNALYSSDPFISSISLGKRLKNKKELEFPEVVKSFFVTKSETSAASSLSAQSQNQEDEYFSSDTESEDNEGLGEVMDELDTVNISFSSDVNA